MTLNEHFKDKGHLEFLSSTELENARYDKNSGNLRLTVVVDKLLSPSDEIELKRLFAQKLHISADSISLVQMRRQMRSFEPSKMQDYIRELKHRLHELGMRTCEYAVNNITFIPPSMLVVEALSDIDLKMLERHNADKKHLM